MTRLVALILADGVRKREYKIDDIDAAAEVVRDAVTVYIDPTHGRTLALLLAGVVLLLIIGCGNCSILLLARGRARQLRVVDLNKSPPNRVGYCNVTRP